MKNALMLPAVLCISAPIYAQDTVTVAAGEEVFSTGPRVQKSLASLGQNVDWGKGIFKTVIPAGTVLVSVSTKTKFKGCKTSLPEAYPGSPCFLDDDGDGRFDRMASDLSAGAFKIEPVPYQRYEVSVPTPGSIGGVVLYQGATADSLKFSYREFTDGLARSAFTEELSIPRADFPQLIAIKGRRIEILKVDGLGLTFRSVENQAPQ